MRADPTSKRLVWPFLLGAAALAVLAFLAFRTGSSSAPTSTAAVATTSSVAAADRGNPAATTSPAAGGSGDETAPSAPDTPALVDLDVLRAKLPDNTYWRLGAPTKDPEILRARVDEERRRNDLYGKVLSNTASEEEIRSYYAERRKISEDYIEFASTALKEYGDRLPEQERGLYELSIKMHKKRLSEVPAQIDDALARKKAQDRRRDEWHQGDPK